MKTHDGAMIQRIITGINVGQRRRREEEGKSEFAGICFC